MSREPAIFCKSHALGRFLLGHTLRQVLAALVVTDHVVQRNRSRLVGRPVRLVVGTQPQGTNRAGVNDSPDTGSASVSGRMDDMYWWETVAPTAPMTPENLKRAQDIQRKIERGEL